MFIFNIVF